MKTKVFLPCSRSIIRKSDSQSLGPFPRNRSPLSVRHGLFWVPRHTRARTLSPRARASLTHAPKSPPNLRCAVLGAGFAGMSVAWHLLQHSTREMPAEVHIFDEIGVGGGASGVSGGLLHPYSPKVKLLWKGEECWSDCLNLVGIAEEAASGAVSSSDENMQRSQKPSGYIVRRRGLLRPATSKKNLDTMHENALKSMASCQIETIDGKTAQTLIPDLHTPLNSAFFMPRAVNINPLRYLEGLFLACQNSALRTSLSGMKGTSFRLHKQLVTSLSELDEMYDVVIICLGARVNTLPELSGRLPLRTCRGIIAHLQVPDDFREEYRDESPSILSDAWMAVQGPRKLLLGSTWEWGSINHSWQVSCEETASALEELVTKASLVYPLIERWRLEEARGGLRAMPPLRPQGSVPLLGCIDDLIGKSSGSDCKYWLIGGLGSRGLLYHGWVGKLTAQAVVSGNENLIPSELTSWRNVKFARD